MKFDDRDSEKIPQTPRVVAGSVDNDGEEAAYILFIDFWHPDLTDEELRALRLFHASVGEHTSKRARVLDGVRQDLERTFAMSGAGPPGAAAV